MATNTTTRLSVGVRRNLCLTSSNLKRRYLFSSGNLSESILSLFLLLELKCLPKLNAVRFGKKSLVGGNEFPFHIRFARSSSQPK